MIKIGFSRSAYDCCVYWKCHKNEKPIYLLLYVDDMLLASQSMTEIARVKRLLNLEFEMKDLGHAKKILGIEITRNRKEKVLYLSQVDLPQKGLGKIQFKGSKVSYHSPSTTL